MGKEVLLYIDPLRDTLSKVELVDHLGSDLTVVNAARVSMHKESQWEFPGSGVVHSYEKKLSKRDCGLISYLAKHQHWTPCSHPQITFRIKMPIFVARQWFKHQIGFTRNEVSRRYVDEAPEFYHCGTWRERAENVKQGSSYDMVYDNRGAIADYESAITSAYVAYRNLLEKGVCPEQARMVLPQSTYTEFIETASLAAYARLCKLRLDPHAQAETRCYADAIRKFIEPMFPVSWTALMEN